MGKHICVYCGKKKVNVELGIRFIKMIGQPMVIGFVHHKCLAKTRPA